MDVRMGRRDILVGNGAAVTEHSRVLTSETIYVYVVFCVCGFFSPLKVIYKHFPASRFICSSNRFYCKHLILLIFEFPN